MTMTTGALEDRYRILDKKGEGTFAEVVKCERISDGTLCAIKRMKGKFASADQVDNLREVQALRRLNPHPNIVNMFEVVYGRDDKTLDMVFELMEMNIYERIKGRRHRLPEPLVKKYMYQLIKALDHMHRHGIFHRDVKPENILIRDDLLKLADLGSCRGIYSKPPFTEYISTRWYRSPECLLTNGFYGYKMDMWSAGCVMFEVMNLYPLFPGTNELDQINKIHEVLGTPQAHVLAKIRKNSPNMNAKFPDQRGKGLQSLLADASPECVDVMVGLLEYDPDARLSARQALKHPYFKDLRDEDKRQARAAAAMAAAVAEPEEEIVEETGPSSLASALKSKLRISRRGTKTTRSVKVRAPAAAAAGGVTDASQESMQAIELRARQHRSIKQQAVSRLQPGNASMLGHPLYRHQSMQNPQQSLQRHASRKTGSLKHANAPKLPPIAVAGAKPSSLSKPKFPPISK